MILPDERNLRFELRLAAYLVSAVLMLLYYRVCLSAGVYFPKSPDLLMLFTSVSVVILGLLHKGKNFLQTTLVACLSINIVTIPVLLGYRTYYMYEMRTYFMALCLVAVAALGYQYFYQKIKPAGKK